MELIVFPDLPYLFPSLGRVKVYKSIFFNIMIIFQVIKKPLVNDSYPYASSIVFQLSMRV